MEYWQGDVQHGQDIFQRIFPDWKENILAVSTDGAHNITEHYQGVVTILENALTKTLVQVCYGSHQIDLVIVEILRTFLKNQFYSIMAFFISYLGWQGKLVSDMETIFTNATATAKKAQKVADKVLDLAKKLENKKK